MTLLRVMPVVSDVRRDPRRLLPPWIDVCIAAAFVALTVAEALFSPGVASPVTHGVVAGLAMCTLAWRRQFPLVVAVLVLGTDLAINPQNEFSTLLSLVLVAFTVGSETVPPRSYVGLALVLVPFLAGLARQGFEPSDAAAAFVFLVGPWAVGGAVRQRAVRTTEAVERADRLEREQLQQAAFAAEQERIRIARELHDIVSHSISVVTIQTQAVRRRLGPEHAREAADLAAVEATARDALAEMRRLFGVLRRDDETASLSPQPGLDDLGRLLEQVRASGLAVRHETEGESYDLPAGVGLAAYRILQEALTNALRHSGATEATVLLRYAPTHLDVVVEDNGRGMSMPSSGGHGLVGVKERVALYGGVVDITSGELGGVRLWASLPVRDSA
jgi:signal transduction histidine kinase